MEDVNSRFCCLHLNELAGPPRPLYTRKDISDKPVVLTDSLWQHVLTFLTPFEIIRKPIAQLSRIFCSMSRSRNLWLELRREGVLFSQRLLLSKKICERRSRGTLMHCTRLDTDDVFVMDRIGFKPQDVALRRVSLATVNAGVDDGVPASVLRLHASMHTLLPHNHILDFGGIELKDDILEIATAWAPSSFRTWIDDDGLFPPIPPGDIEKIAEGHPIHHYKNLKQKQIPEKFFQIFLALAHMENCQVIHRNLKPENIFISDGVVKIGDFSFSRTIDSTVNRITPEDPKERERSGREARRTWYRAPELLFRPDIYGYEVDMWAIGCVLAEAATGEPCFPSECEMDHLFKVFRLCGSPNTVTWPELLEYPNFSPHLPHYTALDFRNVKVMRKKNIRDQEIKKIERFRFILGMDGVDLLQRLLTMHPKKRITASEALKHKYFDQVRSHQKYAVLPSRISPVTQMVFRSQKKVRALVPHEDQQIRRKVLEWIFEAGEALLLGRETMHLAANSFDLLHYPPFPQNEPDQICIGAVCLKIAEAFQEPSKEYYKQTNFADYRERFELCRPTETLVKWEKICWRRLELDLPSQTPWWYFQVLANITEMHSRSGEALVELVLFDDLICQWQLSPHLLGIACFVTGIALTHQTEKLEENVEWMTLRNEHPDFFWPTVKRYTHEMVIAQLSKAASPAVVRDLLVVQHESVRRSTHGRKSIDGSFPSAPWPIDEIVRLSSAEHKSGMTGITRMAAK